MAAFVRLGRPAPISVQARPRVIARQPRYRVPPGFMLVRSRRTGQVMLVRRPNGVVGIVGGKPIPDFGKVGGGAQNAIGATIVKDAGVVGAVLGIPGAAGFAGQVVSQPVLAALTGGLSAGIGQVIDALPQPVKGVAGAIAGAVGGFFSTGATSAAQVATNNANSAAMTAAIQSALAGVDQADHSAIAQAVQDTFGTTQTTNVIDVQTRAEK